MRRGIVVAGAVAIAAALGASALWRGLDGPTSESAASPATLALDRAKIAYGNCTEAARQ